MREENMTNLETGQLSHPINVFPVFPDVRMVTANEAASWNKRKGTKKLF